MATCPPLARDRLIGLSYASNGRANNKGMAVAGLVVSLIGLFVCILWVAAIG